MQGLGVVQNLTAGRYGGMGAVLILSGDRNLMCGALTVLVIISGRKGHGGQGLERLGVLVGADIADDVIGRPSKPVGIL